MSKQRKSTIGTDPLDAVIPPAGAAQAEEKTPMERLTVYCASSVAERARRVCYWERCSLSVLVETAMEELLTRMETEHGGPYDERPTGGLIPGRRPKL